MSTNALANLTKKREDSSAGASRLGSMIQWNPEQFEDATRTGRVDFRTNSSSGIIEFVNGEMHIVEPKYDATPTWHSDLHFGGWHDLLQTQGDIILRLLCVRCISNMPSSALPETLESLRRFIPIGVRMNVLRQSRKPYQRKFN